MLPGHRDRFNGFLWLLELSKNETVETVQRLLFVSDTGLKPR